VGPVARADPVVRAARVHLAVRAGRPPPAPRREVPVAEDDQLSSTRHVRSPSGCSAPTVSPGRTGRSFRALPARFNVRQSAGADLVMFAGPVASDQVPRSDTWSFETIPPPETPSHHPWSVHCRHSCRRVGSADHPATTGHVDGLDPAKPDVDLRVARSGLRNPKSVLATADVQRAFRLSTARSTIAPASGASVRWPTATLPCSATQDATATVGPVVSVRPSQTRQFHRDLG